MKTALVIGAYGLIGSACCRALARAGFHVTGFGRSRPAATGVFPDQDWIIRDLRDMTVPEWQTILSGVDVVVNAAGALQDSPRDNLQAVHVELLRQLCEAAPPSLRLVQISAAGVSLNASTAFFRTKAMGDDIVTRAQCQWVILRPTLVLAPQAYGGTALLRGAAALPGLLPQVFPQSLVQIVHIDDLALAVVAAAGPDISPGTIADITGETALPLPQVMAKMRHWLGLAPARVTCPVPSGLLSLTGWLADALGWLGWRSPLRSTALTVLRDGIRGDPQGWQAVGGTPMRGMEETLSDLPTTAQERLFARFYFVLPLAIAILSWFWLTTGLVTLANPETAAAVLQGGRLPPLAISTIVLGGAVLDCLLGLAILYRPWCRLAALGMILTSLAYLAGGTLVIPHLWLDPLGPLVKVPPSIVLALIVWLGVSER